MSVVMLRRPEAFTGATDLADEAVAVNLPKSAGDESQMKFLLTEGAFRATIRGLMSDVAAAFGGNPDGQLRHNLEPAYFRTQSAIGDFSRKLRSMVTEAHSADANSLAMDAMLRRALGAMDEFWRTADTELGRLLRQRIDGLYRRMEVDLGTAALVWLASLGFILVVARQITVPIR